MRVVAALCAAVLGGGCQVGFKTAAGGATTTAPLSRGVTRSLTFADQGLLLSRIGLGVLSVGAAAGAFSDVKTETTTTHEGNYDVQHTTTQATFDPQQAQKAADLGNAAADPNTHLTSASGGIAARLEVAGTTLGGDTHGWQYDMGYSYRVLRRLGGVAAMFRFYLGVGYGSFSYNDRVMEQADRGPPKFGDGDYGFLGLQGRAGVFLLKTPTSIKDIMGAETYVTFSGNASGPSYAGIGERLQLSAVFVEAEILKGTSSDEKTYGLTVGVGFY